MVKVVLVLSSLVTSPPLSSTSCGINTTLRDPRRVEPSSENVMVASGGRRRGHYCGNLTLKEDVTMATRHGYILTCSGAVWTGGMGHQAPGPLRCSTRHYGHALHMCRRCHSSCKGNVSICGLQFLFNWTKHLW